MASQGQIDEAKQLQEEENQLRRAYKAIQESPALLDILQVLEASYKTSYSVATHELDNPAKAMAALQEANAYVKIKAYINDKFDVAA